MELYALTNRAYRPMPRFRLERPRLTRKGRVLNASRGRPLLRFRAVRFESSVLALVFRAPLYFLNAAGERPAAAR